MATTTPALHNTEGTLEVLTEARPSEDARSLTELDLALLADMCGSVPTLEADHRLVVRIRLPATHHQAARILASGLLRGALAVIGATTWANAVISVISVAAGFHGGGPVA